jgi:gliding motility-associated-like protein
MKKLLQLVVLITSICYSQVAYSQANSSAELEKKKLAEYNKQFFNEEDAIKQAKAKGIPASDIKGYVEFLRNDFSSKKALEQAPHKHSPYETTQEFEESVIYLSPNKTMSAGCPNMGFENYNFTNWTGGIGTVATGAALPVYTPSGATIINAAGNNVSVRNTVNYHTIMTRPSVLNNLYPGCSSFGYDSVTTRAVGSTLVSDVPFVSPYSFDPVSVRMNGTVPNYRGCRLKYITTTAVNNKQVLFSYACVLENGGHPANQSPYLSVEVRNETTGAILPGCTSYTFNPVSSLPSDSLKITATPGYGGVSYRKWKLYSVDLSALPLGTNVSVNFEVGGCTQSGHWGYAYVDAECGGIGTPYANMCSGSIFATLVAPAGYNTYQWLNPAGLPISGATNDTLIVSPATPGDIYSVQMLSPGGCTLTSTVSIVLTTVNIVSINALSSCPGGASGSANVVASGSNGIYTYQWTSTSGPTTGSVVSTSQTATGLAPGTYSVLVASTTCGTATASISVGVSPPFFTAVGKPFCGTSAFIPAGPGSSYVWYGGLTASTQTLIPGPAGSNDTLYLPTVTAGNIYTLVYTTLSGCKDSVKYTMNQIPGGSTFMSNIANVCPGNLNGAASLNLSTPFGAPYNYNITGPGNTLILNSSSASTVATVGSLAAGTYTAVVNDGVCIYRSTFDVNVISTTFTIIPTNTVICFPADTAKIRIDFGATPPSVCGVTSALCSGPPTQLFNVGPFQSNSFTSYPTPFSGWWYSAKHQFLVKVADLNAAGITAGKISSLAFKITALNASPLVYPDYRIRMGCTSLNALPTGVGQPFITGLTTVYNNPSQPISLGWLTHNFSQSYVWDGTSNIIIEVCTGGLTTFPANASIELKQMPYIANMKSASSSSGVSSCPDAATTSLGTYMTNGANMLPNMRFGYCGAAIPANSYTVSVSSNGTITANYGNDSLKISPTFVTPPAGNVPTTYTITVTNPQGLCSATQTVSILYPTGPINMSTIPTSTTICEGSDLDLASSGAVTYNWFYYQSGSFLPIATTPKINVTPPVVGTNTYIVTGTAPCGIPPQTKTITVNVIPKADLVITPLQDVTKCLDKPFTITTGVGSTTPGSPGTPYTYNWTTVPPTVSLGTGSSYVQNTNATTTLVVTVNGNCAKPTSDTIVVSNFVNDLDIAILDSSATCANSPFTLSSLATGGYPTYNYTWNINGNPYLIGSSQNLGFTSPSSSGNYTISVSVMDSCGYQKTAYEVITVLPPCSITIPNVITPNGDNVNDFFVIQNIEYHANSNLLIFDRWGKKVYSNSNYKNEWKAEDTVDGTYFYILDIVDDKKYTGFISVFHGK